jgi:putative ABC transport system permease protein
MRWFDKLTLRLRSLLRRRHVEQELDAELQFHFDQQIEENLAAGMSEADARAAASRALGGLVRIREDCRDALGVRLLDEVQQDLRYAARLVAKAPAFSLMVILTLALGIGANTALFSVVYGVLIRPLPYRDADRLVQFRTERDFTGRPRPVQTNFSLVDLEQWRQFPRSLESIALFAGSRGAVSAESGSEAVSVATVTDGFFATVRGRILLGRPLTATDDQSPVIVISQALWQRQFAGSPSAVGGQLILDSQPYTIVGVTDTTFQLPFARTDVWRTAGFARTLIPAWARRGSGGFSPIARLKPGATTEQARADCEAVLRAIAAIDPKYEGTRVTAMGLHEQLVADVKPAILVLFAAVALVLFVACANVTSLLLARDTSRSREQAVRLALGASRGRLARQYLVYTAVVASCGAVVGIAAAGTIVAVLRSLQSVGIPRLEDVQVDVPVLLFALLATVVTAVVVGLLPAFQSSGVAALKVGAPGASLTRRSRRLRQTLIVAELAVSVVLLVGASLLGRSLVQLMAIDIGVSAEHVTAAQIEVFHGRTSTFTERRALIGRVVERVRSMPGVTSAGAGVALPPNRAMLRITMDRVDEAIGRPTNYLVDAVSATPEYFSTLGVRLQKGRFFNDADDEDHPHVMIMSAGTARQIFGGADPINRTVVIPILTFNREDRADNAPASRLRRMA